MPMHHVGNSSFTSFMVGKKLGWCKVHPVGLKLRLINLMAAASEHPLCTGLPHMQEFHYNQFVTFHEAAALICVWFQRKEDAAKQIELLRDMLRRTSDEFLLRDGPVEPVKRDFEAFRHSQVMPIAKSQALIHEFVLNHHAGKAKRVQPDPYETEDDEEPQPASKRSAEEEPLGDLRSRVELRRELLSLQLAENEALRQKNQLLSEARRLQMQ